MSELIQFLTGALGTLGFALIFRISKKRIPFAVLGGVLACAVYLICRDYITMNFLILFIPAVIATAYAEGFARIIKTPASTLLVPSIISLVPGSGLYYAISFLIAGDMAGFSSMAESTITSAAGIAAGIIVVSVIVNSFVSAKAKRQARLNAERRESD